MGINTESDIEANLQIGPTDKGMVRLFIEAKGLEVPMDFEPDEAREPADHSQLSQNQTKPHHKYTVPNAITAARILATPYISYLIVDQQYDAATAGFVLAGLSDWLDGFIAKHFNQRTVLGSFLDPIADKVFVTLVSAACCSCGILPPELFGVMVTRDAVLVGGAFYLRAKTKSEAADFFDTNPDSDATFEVHPDAVGKVNTVLQFSLLGSTLFNEAFALGWAGQIEALWWIVGTTTIVSGARYGLAFLRDGGAYKGLTPKKGRQPGSCKLEQEKEKRVKQ